jgi:threonine dehydrogenase-like Zn-dependent dehydrogenase
MIAAFVKKYRKVELRTIPTPKPQRNEVLLEIEACGVCGSDYIEAASWARSWKRFGHEIVARVVEIGSDVTQVSVGDQIVVALSVPCGMCAACQAGIPRKCTSLVTAEQGGFAEYLLIKDQRLLYKVDPTLPTGLRTFAEPLSVVLDAFHLANLTADDNLLVVGGGFIGMISVITSRAYGIKTFGVLSRSANNDLMECLAKTGGEHFKWRTLAGLTIGAPVDLKQKMDAISGRLVIFHTAPSCYISKYMSHLPFDSTIVNIGLSASYFENRINVDASRMIFKRLQLLNAFPVPNFFTSQALALLKKHSDLFSLLRTQQISLNDLPNVIKKHKHKRIKLLVTPKA